MKTKLSRLLVFVFALFIGVLPLDGQAAQPTVRARNVILLIGDGMGPSHFAAAWYYSNRVLNRAKGATVP